MGFGRKAIVTVKALTFDKAYKYYSPIVADVLILQIMFYSHVLLKLLIIPINYNQIVELYCKTYSVMIITISRNLFMWSEVQYFVLSPKFSRS